jgi:L-ribulose-5-phosphate 3-epimerase
MALTRREVLAGMVAGVSRAGAQGRAANPPKPRSAPVVCLYSQLLVKVPYDDVGPVIRDLGADGCDLSVQPGGHVAPPSDSLHLMRAIEAISGVGLELPVLSTAYTSLADPTIRTMAGICAEMGVPLFRAGYWKYTAADLDARLAEVQRDITGLAALGRAANMSVAIHNMTGDYVGQAVWDIHMMIRGMDPRTVGYDFDIGYATAEGGAGGWILALRLALPRLKMVTVRDFTWSRETGAWAMTPCPLGEGMVDWPKFMAMLAGGGFTGPISIQTDYRPKDELAAIRHDVEFIKKQVKTVYRG